MTTDTCITVYDAKMANVLCADASADVAGSGDVLQYEDTPNGSGAGKIVLGLRREDFLARGYWSSMNFVEISTSVDTLQQAVTTNLAPLTDTLPSASWTGSGYSLGSSGPGGAASLNFAGTSAANSSAQLYSNISTGLVSVVPGNYYVFSAYVNAAVVSSGSPLISIYNSTGGTRFVVTTCPLVNGRVATPVWLCPAGTTQVALSFANNSTVVPTGSTLSFSQPMFEQVSGATSTASAWYVPSFTSAQQLAGLACRLYVTSTKPWDGSQEPEAQQAFLDNSITKTIRIPVTTYGTDAASGVPYITTALPLGGGTISAYGAGTVVGRRRYCGYILRRSSTNSKSPQVTLSLIGASNRITGVGTFTVANTDVGTAIYNALYQFSSVGRWPFIVGVLQSNFPTVGAPYTATSNRYPVTEFISDALQAISSGDLWAFRVGHDRIPRLVQLYTSATNTYTYNVTLPQGQIAFDPLAVTIADDASNVYNSVEVIGNTDSTTNISVDAIVQDANSIALYGQIDYPPQTNTKLTTQAACVAQATSLLNESSIATQNNGFTVYTRNDGSAPNAPLGVANGDVVSGVTNVTISRNDATGSVRNLVADSELLYATGTHALWSSATAGMTIAAGAGPTSGNAWKSPVGTGAAIGGSGYSGLSPVQDVVPGQTVVLSGWANAAASSGLAKWQILAWPSLTPVAGGAASIAAGTTGRATGTAVAIPTGVTQVVVSFSLGAGAVITAGQYVYWAQPQLEFGSFVSPYVANNAAPATYGLIQSANTCITADGDSRQVVKYSAIEPDWNATMAEIANSATTALMVNAANTSQVGAYCVSANAGPPPISTSSLVVTLPTYLALFAKGTAVVSIPSSSVTLTASQTNWVWLNPSGSYTVLQSTAKVAGAIPYGYFMCSATGVLGFTQTALVGVGLSAAPSGGTFTCSAFSVTGWTGTTSSGQSSSAPNASIAFTVAYTPPTGDPRPFSQWGSGGIYWAKANNSGSSDGDVNPLDYVQVGAFNGSTIPATDSIGPLAAGAAYQIALQLKDQFGDGGPFVILGLTPVQLQGASTIAGANNTNLVPDSDWNANLAYWPHANVGAAGVAIVNPNATYGTRYINLNGGGSGQNAAVYSRPIAVSTGVTITATVQYRCSTYAGSTFFGLVSTTDEGVPNATPATVYTSFTIPSGGSATTWVTKSITYTPTFTGTLSFCIWATNLSTGLMAFQQPQVELGSSFTRYMPGPSVDPSTGAYVYAALPTQVQGLINAAGQLIVSQFTGGVQNGDGSLSFSTGVGTSVQTFALATGTLVAIKGVMAGGSAGGAASILIGNTTNGYGIAFNAGGSGSAYTFKYASGVGTVFTTVAKTYDTNYHSYQLSVLFQGTQVSIEGMIDGTLIAQYVDTSPAAVANPSAVQINTNGTTGKLNGITIYLGQSTYLTLPNQITSVIDPNGNVPSSAPFKVNGTFMPVVASGSLTYTASSGSTSGTSQIIIYWDGTHASVVPALHFPSQAIGVNTPVTAGNYPTVSTLLPSTSYYFAARVDTAAYGLHIQSVAGGATPTAADHQWLNSDGYVAFAPDLQCSTPAASTGSGSGSSPGGGGGGPQCPASHQLMPTTRGLIRADKIVPGDFALWPDGKTREFVGSEKLEGYLMRVRVAYNADCTIFEDFDVEETHQWQAADGSWIRTNKMACKQLLLGTDGEYYPVVGVCWLGDGFYQKLRVVGQEMPMGRVVGHNIITQ